MRVFLYSAVGVCGILRCRVNIHGGGWRGADHRACYRTLSAPATLTQQNASLDSKSQLDANLFHNLLSTACRAIYHVHVSSTHIIGCSTLYWSVSCIQFISLLGKIEFESHKVVSPRNISRAQQHFPKYKIHSFCNKYIHFATTFW